MGSRCRLRLRLHLGQHVLDHPVHHPRAARGRAARRADASGHVGADAGAPGRGPRPASSRASAPCTAPATPRRSACCGSSPSSSAPGSTPSTASTSASRSSRTGSGRRKASFEMKEHLAIIGLGLLPIYWFFWKNARDPEYDSRAQMAHRDARRVVLVSSSSPVTSSTTCGDSDHEHDQLRRAAGARPRSLAVLGGVPHLRDGLRDRDAGHLRRSAKWRTGRCSPIIREPTGSISAGRRP